MSRHGSSTESWAVDVADANVARVSAETERRRVVEAARTELAAAVTTEGHAYIDRIEGAVRSAADAFNARVGHPLLDVHRSAGGSVSIRSRHDGAYVLVVPALSTDDGHEPSVSVAVRQCGRDRRAPYSCVVHNGRLHLDCEGAIVNPEQFVRAQLEPWLRDLPLGGR